MQGHQLVRVNSSPRLRSEINRTKAPASHTCGPECSSFCHRKLHNIVSSLPDLFIQCVHELSFVGSFLDRVAIGDCDNPFRCEVCFLSFACSRALHMHCTKVHAKRSVFKYYAECDGVCPVCKSNYLTRLRLISHLSDPRRTKCSSQLHLCPKLSDARVEELDQMDRSLKRAASKQGHSHLLAVGQATSASGRLLGKPSL